MINFLIINYQKNDHEPWRMVLFQLSDIVNYIFSDQAWFL